MLIVEFLLSLSFTTLELIWEFIFGPINEVLDLNFELSTI